MCQDFAPMLLVDNVDEAVHWYKDILGAKLQHSLPDNPPFEWVSLKLVQVEIMFAQKKAAQKWYTKAASISARPANFIAYLYVKDINKLYDQIKSKVNVIMKPKDQHYGIHKLCSCLIHQTMPNESRSSLMGAG